MKVRLRRTDRNPEGRMSVLDHLRELRRRLIIIVLLIALGAVLGWYLYPHTLHFLKAPYCSVKYTHRFPGNDPDPKHCDLIYTGVLDGFTTRLKVAVISGAIFTAPLWLYQIWGFITPGLKRNERKYSVIFVAASTILFVGGISLAYLVLSRGLQVLIGAAGSGTLAILTVNGYLSFVVLLLTVFGLAFELPLLVIMANLVGVLPAKLLRKSQRIAIFLIFLFAAVATPSTDPFTMCAMAIPMCLLFEGAVVFAIVHDRRKAARKAALATLGPPDLDDNTASDIDPIPRPIDGPKWGETT
jgi:sec-independent protein translocase protein TatC